MKVDVDQLRVIDVDTHVVEPYDLWTSRVSVAKWGDRVPHVRFDESRGYDAWYSGDRYMSAAAGPAQAGWHEPPPNHPPSLDVVNPNLWRSPERLELMDDYGIYAQLLYPNVAGVGGGKFVDLGGDDHLAIELLRAYNDFLTEWSSVAPNRLLPIMALPIWDLDLAIKEMARCKTGGHRGINFSQQPEAFGLPMLSDPHWDRLWAAAQEMELPVNFHIGGGDTTGTSMLHDSCGPAANFAAYPVTFYIGNGRTIATLIGGGICHRFPDLKLVSVESGVGWVPFVLQALDWQWKGSAVRTEHPEYDLLPTEYFQRQIYACFWFESGTSLASTVDQIGADNILYETDFPHPTAMAPGPASVALKPRDFIEQELAPNLDQLTLQKVVHGNAAGLYAVE